MKEVLNHIEMKQKELLDCDFLKWLRSEHHSINEKMSFSPAMILFVMGFKDITELLKTEKPLTEVDYIINTHCDEDAGHWVWYLEDLKKVGVTNEYFGNDVLDTFSELWSDKYFESRLVVYEIVSLIKSEPDKLIHLTVLEILEATFGAFISSLSEYLEKINGKEEFQFFGLEHLEAEDSHESGSWTEDKQVHTSIESLTFFDQSKKLKALKSVDELFEKFESMFDAWHRYALEKIPARNVIKLGDQLHE